MQKKKKNCVLLGKSREQRERANFYQKLLISKKFNSLVPPGKSKKPHFKNELNYGSIYFF